jgi:hypothetical protein
MFAIMKDGKVAFGPVPESDYSKIVEQLNTYPPEEKKNYKVVFTTQKDTPATPPPVAPVQQTPPPAQPPAAKQEKVQETAPTPQTGDDFTFADSSQAFGSFLEGGGSSDYWKPKDGKNLVRLLPLGGINPNDWKTPYPMLMSGVHPNVGLSLRDTVYCPRLTHNQACPICAFVWKLWNTKNKEDEDLARRIKAYKRILMNIIDLSDIEAGVQKYAFGKKLAAKIVSYLQDPDTRYVLHPDKGNNFILIKKTMDGFPNYDESRFEMKSTPLASIFPKWREGINDLRKDIVEKSYDELVEILNQTKKALLTSATDSPIGSQPAQPVEDIKNAQTSDQFGNAPDASEVTEVSLDELDQKLNNF